MGYIGPREPALIDPGSIDNTELADVAQYTFKGRVSSGYGYLEDLTPDQGITLLNQASTGTLNAARLASHYRSIRVNGGADLSQRPRVNYLNGSGIAISGADDGTDFESDITIGLASIATNRVLGNVSGTSAAPSALDSDGLFAVLNSSGTAKLNNNRLEALTPDPTGSYTYAAITVDAQGRVTAAANGTAPLPLGGGTITGNLEIGASGSLSFEGATANGFETTLAVVDPTDDRVITLPDATTTVAGLAVTQTFTAAQRGQVVALSDGATVTPDFALANHFSLLIGGNRTLANPSNLVAGQSGCIWITQTTGSHTLAYSSYWDFPAGIAPTLSTAAGAVDCLVYAVQSSTRITARLINNLS